MTRKNTSSTWCGPARRGKTNKEIANDLDLSEKTVKNHVRNIFHKLQVYDRTQAAILAIRKGLIELDPQHPTAG